MKKITKLVALLMTLVTAMSFMSIAAFAATDNDDTTEPVRHTIEVVLEPGENDGIMPLIWDSESHELGSGTVTYTTKFTPGNRYMAFEASATDVNGNATSGSFTVALVYTVTSTIATTGGDVNGTVYKADWIDVISTNSYQFKIFNYTSTTIKVKITYYSWA